ncbi:MAG TPA: FxsA family protein [Oscillospiraceae bacterium]|nr:FxsA family protein [Oscillospiraceae bacterium]
MLGRLLLLMIIVPILEIFLLIEVGQQIGVLPTVTIVLLTGLLGIMLARTQGFYVLTRIVNSLRKGELPGDDILNGLLVLIGASFLLTPGLITDTAGFILLIPRTRRTVKVWLYYKLTKALKDGTLRIFRR